MDAVMEEQQQLSAVETNEEHDEKPSQGLSIFDRQIREDGRGYYRMSGGRNPVPKSISNFKLMAVAKVVHDSEWFFICSAIDGSGRKYDNIILSRQHFQGASSFKQALSYHSSLEYYGDNRDTTQIQGLLSEQDPPRKIGTDTNGIHWADGKWVYGEGANLIDRDGVAENIVYLGTKVNDINLPHILEQPDISPSQLQAIACNLNRFNTNSVVYPILGWIGSCLMKERLATRVNRHNPILLCQGEPGAGKTETISRIIQPIFSSGNTITNIADATKFTFAVNGSSSNMVPCFYDEWKLSVMQRWQIRNLDSMLLAVYNQTSLPRGSTDMTVRSYVFSAPLVIAGEMSLESASIKHRIIDVFFSTSKRQNSLSYFKMLGSLPLGAFGKGLLQHMLGLSNEKLCDAFECQFNLVDDSLTDRFKENAAIIRTGLWLMIDYFNANGIEVNGYEQGYGWIDAVIRDTMDVAQITNVDKIISDFSIMSNTSNCSGNWLNFKHHYDIKDNIISIRIAETYAAYQKYAKSNNIQAEFISKNSFLQQLKTKKYFIAKTTARIGGKPCNAILLDMNEMPDFIEKDFAA